MKADFSWKWKKNPWNEISRMVEYFHFVELNFTEDSKKKHLAADFYSTLTYPYRNTCLWHSAQAHSKVYDKFWQVKDL